MKNIQRTGSNYIVEFESGAIRHFFGTVDKFVEWAYIKGEKLTSIENKKTNSYIAATEVVSKLLRIASVFEANISNYIDIRTTIEGEEIIRTDFDYEFFKKLVMVNNDCMTITELDTSNNYIHGCYLKYSDFIFYVALEAC